MKCSALLCIQETKVMISNAVPERLGHVWDCHWIVNQLAYTCIVISLSKWWIYHLWLTLCFPFLLSLELIKGWVPVCCYFWRYYQLVNIKVLGSYQQMRASLQEQAGRQTVRVAACNFVFVDKRCSVCRMWGSVQDAPWPQLSCQPLSH